MTDKEVELHNKKAELGCKLDKITEDIIQVICGRQDKDLDTLKQKFAKIHNELRVLEDKEKVIYVQVAQK